MPSYVQLFTCNRALQAAVVEEGRRGQQPRETGRHGQPRFRARPSAAQLAVEVPVQQASGARGQVQQERVAGLDDQPGVERGGGGGDLQQPRQDQAVHTEETPAKHQVTTGVRIKSVDVLMRREGNFSDR